MGQDKGSLQFGRSNHILEDQRTRCFRLLQKVCTQVFISCRESQTQWVSPHLPRIYDRWIDEGPSTGILSAYLFESSWTWLVLACDMPCVDESAVAELVTKRNPKRSATVFIHPVSGKIEPLFSIWEPRGLAQLNSDFKHGNRSPFKTLQSMDCERVVTTNHLLFTNVNTPEEYSLVQKHVFKPT